MPDYKHPQINEPEPVPAHIALLVASGDLRLSANQQCWSAQQAMEKKLAEAFAHEGITIRRAHGVHPTEGHGFISTQRMGMDVFKGIPKDAKVIVATAVWQYSYHVLAGLRDHKGPILTVANWEGQWPGLVGLLNLNASLTKMGVPYSTIWSKNFDDAFFLNGIRQWLREGVITHDTSHVRDLDPAGLPGAEAALGKALAAQIKAEKVIMGIFDEGCMGMYNAFFDDEYLNPMGIYKERLSQSALVAEMRRVKDDEARAAFDWVKAKGLRFDFGADPATDLVEAQVLEQMKMYIAAVRMAHFFGCDLIGIQYQQGLKDMAPASDLVEGLLNNTDRPPVCHALTGEELFAGKPVVHFNEVDEGAGLDALVTNRVWTALGFAPETTLHDIRYGEHYSGSGVDDFVWVFEISGAVPPAHIRGGYQGAVSYRQDRMFFPMGGGTLAGVCKPGEIVWSRVFLMDGKLHADLGRGASVDLPDEETRRRLETTTKQWPIMHGVLYGVSRDQMMARNKSNHLNVVYAPNAADADRALAVKAAMLAEMGIEVHFWGV
jgi:hypothetical protein